MEKQTGRLEAFSDGIFGVAITLLALEIGIKEYEGADNANLWKKILEQWPEYFTYFNSFATVLLIWMGHNKVFRTLRATNHWIILVNGLMLLFVVLFPYPTKLVGSFIGTGAESTAVAFYAGFTGMITFSMMLLNICILKNKDLLLDYKQSKSWFMSQIKGQIIGILSYAGIAILAFYHSEIALVGTFAMWLFWAFATKDNKEELI